MQKRKGFLREALKWALKQSFRPDLFQNGLLTACLQRLWMNPKICQRLTKLTKAYRR